MNERSSFHHNFHSIEQTIFFFFCQLKEIYFSLVVDWMCVYVCASSLLFYFRCLFNFGYDIVSLDEFSLIFIIHLFNKIKRNNGIVNGWQKNSQSWRQTNHYHQPWRGKRCHIHLHEIHSLEMTKKKTFQRNLIIKF